MLALTFAAILSLCGHTLPPWAWALAAGMATVDFLTSDIVRAFWRGLTGS